MSGLTPTQRTLRALREQGRVCAIVEKWNPYGGPMLPDGRRGGLRQDLFGILDVIALDPERGVVGIQSCGATFAEHWRKLTIERAQEVTDWLSTPGTSLELWSWRKVRLRRGGVAMRWAPRVQALVLDDLGERPAADGLLELVGEA